MKRTTPRLKEARYELRLSQRERLRWASCAAEVEEHLSEFVRGAVRARIERMLAAREPAGREP